MKKINHFYSPNEHLGINSNGKLCIKKTKYRVNEHGVILNPELLIIAGDVKNFSNAVFVEYAFKGEDLFASLNMHGHNKGTSSGVNFKYGQGKISIEDYAVERKDEIIKFFSEHTQDAKILQEIKKFFGKIKQPSLF